LFSVNCFLENAMSGRNTRQRSMSASVPVVLTLVLLFSLLAACLPADRVNPRQIVVEWPEKHLVFIADERIGSVQAFYLGAGAPVLAAQTRVFERSTVRDIKLDPARGQLWVLGADAVYVHEVRNLALQKRIPLDARDVAALHIENGGVTLLTVDGVMLGRIDTASLLALWRPSVSVRRG
jgi:hypothetical protein